MKLNHTLLELLGSEIQFVPDESLAQSFVISSEAGLLKFEAEIDGSRTSLMSIDNGGLVEITDLVLNNPLDPNYGGTGLSSPVGYLKGVGGTFSAVTAIPFSDLATATGLSVLGVAGTSAATPASLVALVDGQVLRRSGTTLGFGTLPSTSITGLGTMSTQNANAIAVTGGSLSGITSIAAASATLTTATISGGTLSGITSITATGGTLSGLTSIAAAAGTLTTATISGGTATGLSNVTSSSGTITTLGATTLTVTGLGAAAALRTSSWLDSYATSGGQGHYLGWNRTGGSGEGVDLIARPTGAPGGWWFTDYNITSGVFTTVLKVDNQGGLEIAGTGNIKAYSGYADFGSTTRQMINLWGSTANATYGIGVQSSAMYLRTSDSLALFKAGTHSNTQFDPGAGGTLLARINGNGEVQASNYGTVLVNKNVVGATTTLDFRAGETQVFQTTTAVACTVSFTNPTSPCYVQIRQKTPTTGTAATVTYPTVKGGTIPAMTVVNQTRLITLYWDGTDMIFCSVSANY